MNQILEAISVVGFPIAMSLMLFWYLQSETKSLKEAINKLELAITTLILKLEERL